MEVPPKPVQATGPLRDQVLAVINQQAQLTRRTIQLSHRQVWVAQRGLSDRQGVDRVGLAIRAGRIAGMGHQLRRDPHDAFPSGEHVDLEAS